MKVDDACVSAALEWVLDNCGVARHGAMPLRLVREQWKRTHLRGSDLSSAIEAQVAHGQIALETHHDGLWLRREPGDRPPSLSEKVRGAVRELMFKRTLQRLLRRESDDYMGSNRRSAAR